MTTIAVLMTSFNRKQLTIKCLHNLFQQRSNDYKLSVFLVDDGSTDGTSKEVLKQFPEVTVVCGNGELYWNQGMRLAWDNASAKEDFDFYLWLNDDTFLFENAIFSVLSLYREKKEEIIVVGATCSETNPLITTYGGRNGKDVLQLDGVSKECFTFNGNVVLISQKVFLKLGNLDNRFRHSFGDIEYGMRASKNNIKMFVTPVHVGFCKRDIVIKPCFSPSLPLLKRIKCFYSPLGINPFEYAYLNRIYGNYLQIIKGVCSMHLRVLFPKLWINN